MGFDGWEGRYGVLGKRRHLSRGGGTPPPFGPRGEGTAGTSCDGASQPLRGATMQACISGKFAGRRTAEPTAFAVAKKSDTALRGRVHDASKKNAVWIVNKKSSTDRRWVGLNPKERRSLAPFPAPYFITPALNNRPQSLDSAP